MYIFFQIILINHLLIFEHLKPSQIPNGYYFGYDRDIIGTLVFVKIEDSVAVADFIHWDKYPRELLSDTLHYSQNNFNWSGKASEFYLERGKYYVRSKDSLTIFGGKKEIRIKLNDEYYKRYADEYKNEAILHMYFRSFVDKSKDKASAQKCFQETLKRYNLTGIQKHTDYLIGLEKLKAELGSEYLGN